LTHNIIINKNIYVIILFPSKFIQFNYQSSIIHAIVPKKELIS